MSYVEIYGLNDAVNEYSYFLVSLGNQNRLVDTRLYWVNRGNPGQSEPQRRDPVGESQIIDNVLTNDRTLDQILARIGERLNNGIPDWRHPIPARGFLYHIANLPESIIQMVNYGIRQNFHHYWELKVPLPLGTNLYQVDVGPGKWRVDSIDIP